MNRKHRSVVNVRRGQGSKSRIGGRAYVGIETEQVTELGIDI